MYFSWSPRKVPKEGDSRGHSEKACPLKKPLRRLAIRHPKMFRFSSVYREKTCRFLNGRCSKIGTFLDTGWRCGGGFQRGGIFIAPLWLASFGSFLASQEKNITAGYSYRNVYFPETKKLPFPGAFCYSWVSSGADSVKPSNMAVAELSPASSPFIMASNCSPVMDSFSSRKSTTL